MEHRNEQVAERLNMEHRYEQVTEETGYVMWNMEWLQNVIVTKVVGYRIRKTE